MRPIAASKHTSCVNLGGTDVRMKDAALCGGLSSPRMLDIDSASCLVFSSTDVQRSRTDASKHKQKSSSDKANTTAPLPSTTAPQPGATVLAGGRAGPLAVRKHQNDKLIISECD